MSVFIINCTYSLSSHWLRTNEYFFLNQRNLQKCRLGGQCMISNHSAKCVPCDAVLSLFSSKRCIIKRLIDSVFVISLIIKVSQTVIIIILDITKTSSNNCLKLHGTKTRCWRDKQRSGTFSNGEISLFFLILLF